MTFGSSVRRLVWSAALVLAGLNASTAFAAPCALAGFRPQPGLDAAMQGDTVQLTWTGAENLSLRMRLRIVDGRPRMEELAAMRGGGSWTSIASDLTPEFSVTTGLRRMSQQQLQPLHDLNIPITKGVVDKYRWDPFWDAPLDLAPTPPGRFAASPPPAAGIPTAGQPGLPRSPAEIQRAAAVYHVGTCAIRTDGARIVVSFPGVTLGVFEGRLQYTVYRGSNLIRQDVVATTSKPWVAYKYDAGLKGLPIMPNSRVVWRDTAGAAQAYAFGGAANADKVALQASNRIVVADQGHGAIAAFPPPHKFFWAREVAINMGYNWYRRDADQTYAFGIRQNEREDASEGQANWALYSARPGTEQVMTLFLYPSLDSAEQTFAAALSFTHGDRYKPLADYQVMSHHYHMDLGLRLLQAGNFDTALPDLVALKALGLNIVSQVDNIRFGALAASAPSNQPDQLSLIAAAVAGARIHSDKNFLVLPSQEILGSPLGGHTDLLFSHPVFWDERKPGQTFEETSPRYGKVYHVGGADDLMRMAQRESVMISMPHPRTKGSTGYPDAVKDRAFFKDPHYQGVGMRWGMGIDGSERRLCEYRCWPLLDEMSNWQVDQPGPLKYITSISEVMHVSPGDDIYASQPVTYVRLAALPGPNNPQPVIDALMHGQTFWTTGEVLLPAFAIVGEGRQRKIVADVEWTLPLDFIEVVWGDGRRSGRQVIPTTDLPPMGRKHFEIPLDARGKKWVRFAAWDIAADGAVTQPIRLKEAH